MALVKLQVLTEQGSYFSSTGEFTMVDNGFGVTRGRGVCRQHYRWLLQLDGIFSAAEGDMTLHCGALCTRALEEESGVMFAWQTKVLSIRWDFQVSVF